MTLRLAYLPRRAPWLTGVQAAPQVDRYSVPSGQIVTLQDVFWEEGDALTLRVRFLAPQIARAKAQIDYDTAAKDMLHLCEAYVLPSVAQEPEAPDQIIVSLSDIEVPFGQSDPEATQFFEAYRIENGACKWEVY